MFEALFTSEKFMNYEFIIAESSFQPHIALIRLNRPKELNALNLQLMQEIKHALLTFDQDDNVRCIIITGNERAFAAGADIKQMESKTAIDMLKIDQFETWDQIRKTKKPIIAAVNGFALGGGCELAMTCDMIIAGESAKFGQPEVNLGLIPGYGGTQRLTQLVGKGRAMELCMTAQVANANEALAMGLVNHVTPLESLIDKAKEILTIINTKSPMALSKVIACINKTGSADGFETEIKQFGECFGTPEMKEGVSAFLEKRKANFG